MSDLAPAVPSTSSGQALPPDLTPRARALAESFPVPMHQLGFFHHYPPGEFARAFADLAPPPFPAGEASLYVHIPFCRARCPYCPFVTFAGRDAGDLEDYAALVAREAARGRAAAEGAVFSALYFGGGTPGLLPPAVFARLRRAIDECFRFTPDRELTVEFDPVTAGGGRLAAYVAEGVTRVSVGVQSFDPAVLAAVGRSATAAHLDDALDALDACGAADRNLDLMVGLPGQDRAVLDADLARAAARGLPSLTLYPAVYPPPQRMYFRARGLPLPTRDEQFAEAWHARAVWAAAGYRPPPPGGTHFQRGPLNPYRAGVSEGRPVLGLGLAAHSSAGASWWRNVEMPARYLAAVEAGLPPLAQVALVPPDEAPRKFLVEGLKTGAVSGVAFARRFGAPVAAVLPDEWAAIRALDLMEEAEGELRFTRTGAARAEETRFLFAAPWLHEAVRARPFAPVPEWMQDEWAALEGAALVGAPPRGLGAAPALTGALRTPTAR